MVHLHVLNRSIACATKEWLKHSENTYESVIWETIYNKSSSKVKPASKKTSARHGRTMYPEDDQFNQFLSLAIKRSVQSEPKEDKELSGASRMVELMNAFNAAKIAMQCPIQAAYHCPIFEQFLDKKERKSLKKYKQEQEEDGSDSESGST